MEEGKSIDNFAVPLAFVGKSIFCGWRSLCCSRGGMTGGQKVVIEPHRHEGVFIARGKEDALVTKNLTPGKQVYGEKLVKVDVSTSVQSDPVLEAVVNYLFYFTGC